ncbi:MAG: TRAP transporter small permease [Deltaproteobacteria bacterium]|nr:TRAP transporter small permease [Deltaproteobacteria bacterium]MBM4389336.1 TRAP transporter small permease [Deltaproteobacteria bacterium]
MLTILDRTLKYLLTLFVMILTASVFLQVLIRFVFKYPLPWTEEVSRIAFVYSIFIGATIAVREKTHLNVDVLLVILPKGVARSVMIFGSLLVAIFLGFVTWEGIVFVRATGVQMTPVMQIPFKYLYLILPASGALMLLYLVLGTMDSLHKKEARK